MKEANKIYLNLKDVKARYIDKIKAKIDDFCNTKDTLKSMDNSLRILEVVDSKLKPYFKVLNPPVFTSVTNIQYVDTKIKLSELKRRGVVISTPIDNLDNDKVDFAIISSSQKREWELRLLDSKSQQ